MNAAFGYINRVDTGLLTAGSQVTSLPVSSLTIPRAAYPWQTAGVTRSADGAWMQLDAGEPVTWQAFSLHGTNGSSSMAMRVMLGSAAGAHDIYDATQSGLVPGRGQIVHVAPAEMMARYLRIEIDDAANSDGFIRVGLAYAGPLFVPEWTMSFGAKMGWDVGGSVATAKGGTEFPSVDWSRRVWDVAFDCISDDETFGPFGQMLERSLRDTNVLFLPYLDLRLQSTAIFGRLQTTTGPRIDRTNLNLNAYRATVTERL